MSLIAAVVLAAACGWLGREATLLLTTGRGECPPAPRRLLPAILAGLVCLHLVLTILQTAGVRWSRLSIVVSLLAVGGGLGLLRRGVPIADRPSTPQRGGEAWSWWTPWGDGLAIVATAVVVASAFMLRSVHPDFIYHWGIKAKKYWLAGGIDFSYLARPWNHYTHPDYPNLLPELYATISLLAGRFHEPGLLAASALFFAGLVLAAREALQRSGATPAWLQAGTALVAVGMAAFTLGYRQPGGADVMIALAPLVAMPALQPGASRRDELALGVAAAFAAASKIEGVPLAAFLVVAGLGFGGCRRRGLPGLARMAVPAALVVLPWVLACLRYGLFQPTNTGPLDSARWRTVAAGLAEGLASTPWHGFPYLVVLLPVLLFPRKSRALSAVLLAQLIFYLYVYFSTPLDAALYIRTSFPRLLFHLVPATLVAILVSVGAEPGPTSLRTPSRRHPRRD